jgi:hypothetical protein
MFAREQNLYLNNCEHIVEFHSMRKSHSFAVCRDRELAPWRQWTVFIVRNFCGAIAQYLTTVTLPLSLTFLYLQALTVNKGRVENYTFKGFRRRCHVILICFRVRNIDFDINK